MNHRTVPSEAAAGAHLPINRKLACLILLIWCSTMLAQNAGGSPSAAGGSGIRATHVLGLEGVSSNVSGNLSIEANTLQFQKAGGSAAQVSISSIQDVSLGVEDKQVGGVPMALGRAATPFGGGRVVGLFSHKKYDTLTLEYLDANGGLHGAIFQLNKGRAQVLRNELIAKGAHVTQVEDQPAKQSTPEVTNEHK